MIEVIVYLGIQRGEGDLIAFHALVLHQVLV